MPPFLRDGQPVNQRSHSQPTGVTVYICQCNDCSQDSCFNPLFGRFIAGRQWTRRLYVDHRRGLNSQTNDSQTNDPSLDYSGVVKHDSDPSLSDHSDHPAHSQPSSGIIDDQEHTDDSELIILRQQFDLRQKSIPTPKGLIFLRPPQLSDTVPPPLPSSLNSHWYYDIESGDYSLDPGRLVNQPLLAYHRWLLVLIDALDSLTLSSEADSQRTLLLGKIYREFGRIETLKLDEWKLQHEQQSYARRVAQGGVIHVVDTGMRSVYHTSSTYCDLD